MEKLQISQDTIKTDNLDATHAAFPSIAALAGFLSMSPDRVVECLTLILGSAGIAKLLQGSRQLSEKKFERGTQNIGIGNATLFSTAFLGEMIRNGEPGIYTFSEIPFLLAGIKDLIDSKTSAEDRALLGWLQSKTEYYDEYTALCINGIIYYSLYVSGNIQSIEQWLLAIGFTGLSTSFSMNVRSKEVSPYSKQNVRRVLAIASTVSLTVGALMDTVPSIPKFAGSMDIKDLAVVPAIWSVLNGIFLSGEIKIFCDRVGISQKISRLCATSLEENNSYDMGTQAEGHEHHMVNAFESLMH
jgi:hypothetical protein